MTPEQILEIPPRILTRQQREFFFANGYLLLERVLDEEWIARLRAATDEMIERSRAVSKSDSVFDLEPDHTRDHPRLRRVTNPAQQHPAFWAYCNDSPMPDIVADLVGPDVKFHHSKLNFKWKHGGEEVKWHYDIGFFPHTNYSVLTVGTYLYDCGMEQGPLGVIPGSHLIDPLPTQYSDSGEWAGYIQDRDLAQLATDKAVYLTGPAGSLTIHHCKTVHGSKRNESKVSRPLLLNTLTSGDAFPYTVNPIYPEHDQQMLRGKRPRFAHIDPRACEVPPDWSKGYTSIFALQQEAAAR
ncbi:MAG: phytanoyl-CoA dioxygenase family protein [Betaproteobacteria bacterium]|nr:MAG: phytanoyl-CoA dioxygenase family protein [Betaproteobacteria bacterium]